MEIKKYIDGADVADGDEFFNKLKSFIDKEINIFSAKEKVLNKSFEYDKIYKLQNDIFSSDLTAKRKIDALGNLLETKNAIKGLFPKEQEPKKVKSKKRQEKTIVSKMKNYEVNTETVQKEVSSKKKKKKNKKKKK